MFTTDFDDTRLSESQLSLTPQDFTQAHVVHCMCYKHTRLSLLWGLYSYLIVAHDNFDNPSPFLSIPRTLSRTHTRTHTHFLSLSLSFSHTHSPPSLSPPQYHHLYRLSKVSMWTTLGRTAHRGSFLAGSLCPPACTQCAATHHIHHSISCSHHHVESHRYSELHSHHSLLSWTQSDL